jgi:hypothetical protein
MLCRLRAMILRHHHHHQQQIQQHSTTFIFNEFVSSVALKLLIKTVTRSTLIKNGSANNCHQSAAAGNVNVHRRQSSKHKKPPQSWNRYNGSVWKNSINKLPIFLHSLSLSRLLFAVFLRSCTHLSRCFVYFSPSLSLRLFVLKLSTTVVYVFRTEQWGIHTYIKWLYT